MCGFVGFCDLYKDVSNENNVIEKMSYKIKKRGPDEEGYFKDEHIHLGHRRLIILDSENGKQPMTTKYKNSLYTIVYNGQIYNKEELRKELIKRGFEFTRLFRYRSIT